MTECAPLRPVSGTSPGKTQLTLTALSFTVRVYTLGGPFQMIGLYQPQIASCVLVLWTLIVPLFVEVEQRDG